MMRPALLLLLILLLAAVEVVVFCAASGHSFEYVASFGFIPDQPRSPL